VLLTDGHPITLTLLLILLLGCLHCSQLIIPVGLERISDQPVRRVHVKIASLGQVSFVLCSLDCFLAESVHLI
jgi:hypothetical protein